MFDDKGGEMYPKSKQILEYSKGEEWKMQCKRMHGDRGRYLVDMGEKCNLMIPWTKVQFFFHCSYGSNHTIVLHWPQAIVSQLLSSRKHFVLWTNQMPVAF